MKQLNENINLVICQKSKVQDWLDHFNTYYSEWCDHVFDLTVHSQMDVCFWEWSEGNRAIGIINYELIFRRPKLMTLENFTLVCDESGLLTNDAAKRTKAVMKLHYKNILLLSGSVCGGKYERLWSQMHLLGWNISKDLYWKQFVTVEYLQTVSGSVPLVTEYRNVPRLKRKMAEHGCQFLKTDEVFDLPDQIFQKIRISTTKEYRTFRKDHYVMVGSEELVGDTTLTKMLYERMLCSFYNDAKLQAFEDLIESTNDRLVVFYNFNRELGKMTEICRQLGRQYSVMNGTAKDLTSYNTDPASITFVQYQAGAKGLNLQKANKIIYFSPTLSCEDWMQSQKRIHRLGQGRPCFYYQLVCQNSIEEKIYSALSQGVDYTNALFERDEK